MAGERLRSSGEEVVGRAKSENARQHRPVAGPRRDREAADGLVRVNVAKLFGDRLPAGNPVRPEISAAETTSNAGDTDIGRRFKIGKDGARSERARYQRHN